MRQLGMRLANKSDGPAGWREVLAEIRGFERWTTSQRAMAEEAIAPRARPRRRAICGCCKSDLACEQRSFAWEAPEAIPPETPATPWNGRPLQKS